MAYSLGVSPMKYVRGTRIKRAQELLLVTRQPVADIAEKVGFTNPSDFSRLFRKFVGVSPLQYRKTYGNYR